MNVLPADSSADAAASSRGPRRYPSGTKGAYSGGPGGGGSGTGSRARAMGRPSTTLILALAAVAILAVALRFIGLDWGRPFVYHPDEWVIANPAIDMVRTGSWDPRLYLYPSGLVYVERLIVAAISLLQPSVSLATNPLGGYADLPWRGGSNALLDQFVLFYAGRAFVATLGALTVLPTYLAARSMSNVVGGLAAALVIAVAPLAVLNSHYLTTDVPSAAFAALTLCLALRSERSGGRWLLAAGFAAGLAASTKYNGGLVVIVPLVMLLASSPPRQWLRRTVVTRAAGIALASIAGFILLTPAVVYDFARVWTGGIIYQLQAYSAGLPGAQGSDNGIYFLRVLWSDSGLGPGLSVLAVAGLLIAMIQHRRGDVAVLTFVAAYFVLVSVPTVRFSRNLLPLLPFLAVLSGRAVGWLYDALPAPPRCIPVAMKRRAAAAATVALLVAVAMPSLSSAISSDRVLQRPDTRTIALQWIEANVPLGATIVREEFTPQVPNPEYRVGFVWLLANKPLDWYREAGFEYAITSSVQFDRYRGHPPQDSSTVHSSPSR